MLGRFFKRSSSAPVAATAAAGLEDVQRFFAESRFDEAARCLAEQLQVQPGDVRLLHLLGVARGRSGDFAGALAPLTLALTNHGPLADDATRADLHAVRGNCLRGLGRPAEALADYDEALRLVPGDAAAWNNRGGALSETGRLSEALASFEHALTLDPAFADALESRGVTLGELARHEEALAHWTAWLDRDAASGTALAGRAAALTALARDEEALAALDAMAALPAAVPGALHRARGVARHRLKRHDEALASFDAALALDPDDAQALYGRGVVLGDLGRSADGLACIDRALHSTPADARLHFHRGVLLNGVRRFDEALASYERAIALAPHYAEAHNNRGVMLRELRRYDEAMAAFDRAVHENPRHAPAYFNRANLLLDMRRLDQALTDVEKAIELDPHYPYARSVLLHAKQSCCDWRGIEALWAAVAADIDSGNDTVLPFCCQALSDSPAQLRHCAETYAHTLRHARARSVPPDPAARVDGRIRVGYVSCDFRHHAVAILLTELIERHDKSRFEVYGFDAGWDDGSAVRARLNRAFTRIIDIAGLPDEAGAAAIRDAGIDVLVDLNGNVGEVRRGLFNLAPAPVQVTYLGFPGTTGAPHMDYIIADGYVIPEGDDIHYTEKVVRLPDTYQVNDTKREIATPTPSRASFGLPDDAFVFCCFNNNFKFSPRVFDVWARLVRRLDHAVLWLLEDNPAVSRNLYREAQSRGVPRDRLVFGRRVELADYLARYRAADLFLDTVPYNAHTTASDALWAGLPVLTCSGHTFPGRVGGSLLRAVGLPELITDTLEAYEALAYRLATTPELMATLRARLASNIRTQPLFDSDRFRRSIEQAYTTMHGLRVSGQPPHAITVTPPL